MSGKIPTKALEQINEILSEQMGLRFPQNRLRDLERGLLAACRELNLTGLGDCLLALRSSKLSREQVELLASHLTVGETYFFRDPKSFDVLERLILPGLIASRRATSRMIRVWCAGCSSGEEAYSLAILLQRLIPNWRAWSIVILGTDINPEALRKAERAIYGNWSFRGTGEDFKERHFENTGDNHYELKEEIRDMVQFSYLNLAEEQSYPSLATNTVAMDLVFCRNVLMYFSADTIRNVTGRFFESLTEGGWVVTSPSEASAQYFPGFQPVNFPGAIFFRKAKAVAEGAEGDAKPEQARLLKEEKRSSGPRSRRRSFRPLRPVEKIFHRATVEERAAKEIGELLREGEEEAVIPPHGERRAGFEELEVLARAWANGGNLPKALACCERATSLDPLAVRFHYLKAAILLELGDGDGAAVALRKALFLDRNFVMAHFTLANVNRQRGKRAEARRSFRRAAELLSGMNPDESPAEAEGMNAGSLYQMVEANLRSLT